MPAQATVTPATQALISAIEEQNVNEVRRLLAGDDVDVNATTKDAMRPAHYAAETGNLDILQLLVAHGADAKSVAQAGLCTMGAPIALAGSSGHEHVVRYLVNDVGVNLDEPDGIGMPPLFSAVHHVEDSTYLHTLLKVGVNVDHPHAGLTATAQAIILDNQEGLRALLDAGANATAMQREKIPLTHVAAFLDRTECLRMLVEAGASDPGLRLTNDEKTQGLISLLSPYPQPAKTFRIPPASVVAKNYDSMKENQGVDRAPQRSPKP